MKSNISFTNKQFQYLVAMLAMVLVTVALCVDKLEDSQSLVIYTMALAYVFGYANGNKAKNGGGSHG